VALGLPAAVEAVRELDHVIDVCVINAALFAGDGVSLVRLLRGLNPAMAVLFLTRDRLASLPADVPDGARWVSRDDAARSWRRTVGEALGAR